jgi:CelD/BcsL family acetyltransferase involved in cellulose biosynthesis
MADAESLGVEVVRDDRALAALEDDWRALEQAAGRRNPFVSWSWTTACRAHIRPGAELFVLVARAQDGRMVGVAPLCVERTFGMRLLRFLADGRSDYLGFLVDPSVPGVERALLERLAELAAFWDVAVLRHLTPDYARLDPADMPPALTTREIEGNVSSHLAFAGDFESLVDGGPRGPRHARRWVRRFDRRGGRIVRLTGAEAVARLDDVCGIEARSWKGRAGTARFQPGAGRELLSAALAGASEGSMELWLALLDDQPIAFQINFLAPGRVLYYQGAYDEAHRSHYAGGVLHHHALERAWAEGRREYDFMVGDEAYKAEWTTGARNLRYLALVPDTARGRAAYRLLVAPRWLLKSSAAARWGHARWVLLRGRLTTGRRGHG